ncbi:MAG: putative oxidoreductase, aryl-alcohol dehydrogenase like protein [Microbacteriaceae bacterium]|nr:putative oxidoreductase, aryl-alcohol dehydrogenase like protein [Microbacteriaceae bacterium]
MNNSALERKALRWGVLGAGGIAQQFVAELGGSAEAPIVAAASRDGDRAAALVAQIDGATAYSDYEALLRDTRVDAVYVATIHPHHEELVVAAASAGKHILCEKPITMDAFSAQSAIAAASSRGVALVEAMMYRFQPQTEEIRRLLADGAIGRPMHIDVACVADVPFDPRSRLYDPRLGGGAILDVGCYAMSYARMVAGWVAGDDSVEPVSFSAAGHLAETGVDDWAEAELAFADGFSASVRTGIRPKDPSEACISGSEGYLRIPNPWTPGKNGEPQLVLHRVGAEAETITTPALPLFGAEVSAVADAVERGESERITLRDSLATMRALDRWRAATAAPASR